MAFEKNVINVYEYEYDFAVDGGATGVIDLSAKANKKPLPVGALRKEVTVLGQTAFAGTSASAKFGHTNDDDAYGALAGVATWAASAVSNTLTPAKVVADGDGDVLLTISGAALTAGKVKVVIEFYVPTT